MAPLLQFLPFSIKYGGKGDEPLPPDLGGGGKWMGAEHYQCVSTQSQELVPLDEFAQGSAFSQEEVKCTAPGCSQLGPLFSLFCFGLFFP